MSALQQTATDESSGGNGESHLELAARVSSLNPDEARRLGALETAQSEVERGFGKRATDQSPISLGVWRGAECLPLFNLRYSSVRADIADKIKEFSDLVASHVAIETVYGSDGKLSPQVIEGLSRAGYWGFMIPKEYGGLGGTMAETAALIETLARIEPTIAGLASIHGCIGAVFPTVAFGNQEQKAKHLPDLASGQKLSAFALTEPGAGSDLTRIRTTARRDGDDYVINGEKLFISNAGYGRKIAIVAVSADVQKSEKGSPPLMVLLADLPQSDTPEFSIKRYDIRALRRIHNVGLLFNEYRVPAENLLYWSAPGKEASPIKGLNIAYSGLNRGRVSLCANAAGTQMGLLKGMIEWAAYRETYGDKIGNRELVQRRIGLTAGNILGSRYLAEYTGNLLDKGYMGELECIVAKVFGSERQKETAIEFAMKTHGGRSFLGGHSIIENLADLLAPCIYEGEGEMLSMAFTKNILTGLIRSTQALVKRGAELKINIEKLSPELLMKCPKELAAIVGSVVKARGGIFSSTLKRVVFDSIGLAEIDFNQLDGDMKPHVRWALNTLANGGVRAVTAFANYKLGLVRKQTIMTEISDDVQRAVTVLTAAFSSSKIGNNTAEDKLEKQVADLLCRRMIYEVEGGRKLRSDLNRRSVKVGRAIFEAAQSNQLSWFSGMPSQEILQRYQANS